MPARALALDDFFAKHGPEGAIEIDERGRRPQLHQIARAIERHRMAGDDAARRTGGEHDHFVGERDRFFEIVGDEEDGLSLPGADTRVGPYIFSSSRVGPDPFAS